ncbi:MAG: hypothetical protein K0U41_00890, partial [Gammaproteobacteria bacterium]|nr:hypothetical protein [Gammaproteobacteria bacterium]
MKLGVLLLAISIGLVACGGGSSGGSSLAIPAVPSGLSWSVIDDNTISLNWDNVSNAAHYIISRNGINPLRNITIADSNYTDAGVIANNDYEYQIAACNAGGCSTRATLAVNYFFPPAPSSLMGTVVSGGILLNWEDVSRRATSYAISRRGLDTVSARSDYFDSSVSENNQYSYSVVACNGMLCSAAAMVTADYFVPAVPSGLLGDVVSGGITLNWDAVDNATSYTL